MKDTIIASVVAGVVVYYLTRVAVPAVTQSTETEPADDAGGIFDGLFDSFKTQISNKLDDLLPPTEAETESEIYA